MKQEYIILRDPQHASQSQKEGKDGLAALPELHELSLKEAESIRQEEGVIAMAPNMPVELVARSRFDKQSFKAPADQNLTWGWKAMGLEYSHLDGSGTVAAILDTGIDRNHPAFAQIELYEEDFTGDGDGDCNGHGTHAAGVIFGNEADGLRIGGAPKVDYALVAKVLDEEGKGESFSAVKALLWAAENDANVIVLSIRFNFAGYVHQLTELGYPSDVATPVALEAYHETLAMYQKLIAILRLNSEGLVVIAGAGDSNQRAQNLAWDKSVDAPARIKGVISVGAIGVDSGELFLGEFSNSGPIGVAPGLGIVAAEANTLGNCSSDGTSLAACYVGGAALLWAQLLKQTNKLDSFSLEAKLLTNADKRGGEGDRGDFGIGLFTVPDLQSGATLSSSSIQLEEAETVYEIDSIDVRDLKAMAMNSMKRKR